MRPVYSIAGLLVNVRRRRSWRWVRGAKEGLHIPLRHQADSGGRHNRRYRAVSRVHAPGLYTGTDTAIGNATIMHIPAIVGGALEGPIVGLLAGAIFGIFSCRRITRSSTRLSPLRPACSSGWWRGPSSWGCGAGAWISSGRAGLQGILRQYGRGGRSRHTLQVAARCYYSGHPAAGPAEAVLAAVVTVIIVRGVMLFRSGRTTAPENESDEERRY